MKRWYDSRARVTLKTVAAWLRVPWRKVTNFECLLVYQLMLPSEDKGRAPATPWEHSLRAAKIGAAALGIGALFAVTGESQRTAPVLRHTQIIYPCVAQECDLWSWSAYAACSE